MNIYGTLKKLVGVWFSQNSQDVKLTPNSGTTYTAARTIQLPAGDADRVLVGRDSTDTLSNKTLGATALAGSLTPDTDNSYSVGDATHALTNAYTRNLRLNGSTSGTLTHAATASTTSHTLTWPSAQGGANTVLSNDGSGGLSWASVASSALTQYLVDIGNASNNRTATNTNLLGRIAAKTQTATVTMTIATPCVVTWTSHGLTSGDTIYFTTTGALPTGVSASTTYYVTVVDANTFKLSTTVANYIAGTFVASSGSQSGTHTGVAGGFAPVAGTIMGGDLAATITGDKTFTGQLNLVANDVTKTVALGRYSSGTKRAYLSPGRVSSDIECGLVIQAVNSTPAVIEPFEITSAGQLLLGVDDKSNVMGLARYSSGSKYAYFRAGARTGTPVECGIGFQYTDSGGTARDGGFMDSAGSWTLGSTGLGTGAQHTLSAATSSGAVLLVQSGTATASSTNAVVDAIYTVDTDCTGGYFFRARNSSGTTIGRIEAASNTTTSFTGSSDARLKQNPTSFDGTALLLAMEPKQYEWKSNPERRVHGFYAQELHAVYPEAVSVGNDETSDSGDLLNPWGIDYGRMTPVLVKAFQELNAKLEAALARIAALEGIA